MIASCIAVFCCFLLKKMHQPTLRKAFATAAGIFIHFYTFGCTALTSVIFNCVVYLMFLMLPRRSLPLLTFLIGGLLLSSAQLHKQIYYFGLNGLDLAMTLMFGYSRVTSLACCLRDGETVKIARQEKKEPDLKRREIAFAVEEVPSVFSYISYMYCIATPISGPWLEYKDLM